MNNLILSSVVYLNNMTLPEVATLLEDRPDVKVFIDKQLTIQKNLPPPYHKRKHSNKL
ncbi:MAG: hypothetical protein ABI415_02650 [Flavitalea sp.]